MNAALLMACALLSADADARPTVVVVVGAEGTAEFGRLFRQWAGRWEQAAGRAGAEYFQIGLDAPGAVSYRDFLKQRLTDSGAAGNDVAGANENRKRPPLPPLPKGGNSSEGSEALWLVLIGHGTFDGKTARFNMRGPDVSAAELALWLNDIGRPVAIIDCTSASSPFINELSGPDRVVITATKSGYEHNFARFGDYLSAAIADPRADIDKDEQTSLLEAFLLASSETREWYAREGRLATEHALLDDNGDSLGTPADWFLGTRAVKRAKDGAKLDGLRAGQLCLVRSRGEQELPAEVRSRRDKLEQNLARLRERKGQLEEEEYLKLLEPLLVEIARIYEEAEPKAEGKKRPAEGF
jgi:hypothetical protein